MLKIDLTVYKETKYYFYLFDIIIRDTAGLTTRLNAKLRRVFCFFQLLNMGWFSPGENERRNYQWTSI